MRTDRIFERIHGHHKKSMWVLVNIEIFKGVAQYAGHSFCKIQTFLDYGWKINRPNYTCIIYKEVVPNLKNARDKYTCKWLGTEILYKESKVSNK